ncbi:hypothetical protein ACIQZB_43395 [Streptomyces sp. NPDC097727]|uniref:hypothetical protein n=1 Tax=Streptomyces sp. NPDC097727 TaxID=3366092 RepID=UPI0037F41C90
MPEQRDAVELANALQPDTGDFAAAATGEDEGLPDVADPAVVRVEVLEPSQVVLVGQGACDVVREGAASARLRGGQGDGDDELSCQAETFGVAGFQGRPQNIAGAAEGGGQGAFGDRTLFVSAAVLVEAEGLQPVLLAVPLVVHEIHRVVLGQQSGVVTAVGGLCFEEGAELDASSPGAGEGAVAARRIGGEPGVQEVPEQIAEPALGDGGQIDHRAAVTDADAVELGVDEAGVLGALAGEVDVSQVAEHDFRDVPGVRSCLRQIEVREGVDVLLPAFVGEVLKPGDRPVPSVVGLLRVTEHRPLDLGLHQRAQAQQGQLVHPGDRTGGRAPRAESGLVRVGDHRQVTSLQVPRCPARRERGAAGPARVDVTMVVLATEAERVVGDRRAGNDLALPEPREWVLSGQPGLEVGLPALVSPDFAVADPAFRVQIAHTFQALGGHFRTEQAGRGDQPFHGGERLGGREEVADVSAVLLPGEPFAVVGVAELLASHLRPSTVRNPTRPAVGRVCRRDVDGVRTEQRIEVRCVDQRLQHLEPVGDCALLVRAADGHQRQGGHSSSPQTVRRAWMNSGECWSG